MWALLSRALGCAYSSELVKSCLTCHVNEQQQQQQQAGASVQVGSAVQGAAQQQQLPQPQPPPPLGACACVCVCIFFFAFFCFCFFVLFFVCARARARRHRLHASITLLHALVRVSFVRSWYGADNGGTRPATGERRGAITRAHFLFRVGRRVCVCWCARRVVRAASRATATHRNSALQLTFRCVMLLRGGVGARVAGAFACVL